MKLTLTRFPTAMLARRLPSAAAALGFGLLAGEAFADPSALPPSFAYDYGATETPRSAGVGAMHALGSGLTALFLNPANLGLTRTYQIGALAQVSPEGHTQNYGGAVMDSTRRISGGIGFVAGFQDPDGLARKTLDTRAALGFAVSKEFHLGVGGRFLNVQQDGLGPLGASRASGGLVDPAAAPGPNGAPGRQRMIGTVTADAGLTIKPIEALALSAYGRNLTLRKNGLLPTVFGGAIGFGTADLSVEADAEVDFTSYSKTSVRAMAGGEFLLFNRVPLRAGYRFDALAATGLGPSHAVNGGVGYLEPRFGVEAAVRRTVSGPSSTSILVQLTYFLDAGAYAE
jgi:hypothetical protein